MSGAADMPAPMSTPSAPQNFRNSRRVMPGNAVDASEGAW
jgi:hypothetical protein